MIVPSGAVARSLVRSWHVMLGCTAVWAVCLSAATFVWARSVGPITLLLVPVQAVAGVVFGWSWCTLTGMSRRLVGMPLWRLPVRDSYILGGDDGHTPVPATWFQCMDWLQEHLADRRVGNSWIHVTGVDEPVHVSTVFIGWATTVRQDGVPMMFETMIFGGPLSEHQWRYATWEEAEAGHEQAVRLVATLNLHIPRLIVER